MKLHVATGEFGVLGLLAVVQAEGAESQAHHVLEKSNGSGSEMTLMFVRILDCEDLYSSGAHRHSLSFKLFRTQIA